MDYSYLWSELGSSGRFFTEQFYWIEVPFIIMCSLTLFFPKINSRFVRYFFPLVPFLVLYLMFDLFYNYLMRMPLPSDFQNMISIFEFELEMAVGTVFIFLLIPASIVVLAYSASKNLQKSEYNLSITVRLLIIASAFFALTSSAFIHYHKQIFNYSVWSQEDTIRENGKFSSFIYYANNENSNNKQLNQFKASESQIDIHKTLFPGDLKQAKNIHIIALESFFDPRLIQNIEFTQPILAQELNQYLNNQKSFSFVTSPIYGGGTAQAEFELLTGVKALSKVNQIEFNVMQGNITSSFVNHLNQHNYQTLATIAASPSFFNSKQAYKSLDFSKVTFIEEQIGFMRLNGEGPIFDGELFDYNLNNLRATLSKTDQPIFNYVLGMYGHMPFARDLNKRPDISNVIHADERVKRISNQFYYRTKAIAEYIKALIELDPNSIIFITGDHLPSIFGKEIKYTLDNKTNISLFIENGKTIDVSGKRFYEMPWYIWDRLSKSEDNRQITSAKMESLYFTLLSQSQL
ncbi:sulfatase-like hydrolase/transferase [Thalassotalea fonticola]|uniref:Sulfatase-like hydrolase/transferase n=1 Tax=Thalassotalea fonticola TaxID=3065649 RepID=A0ABZ0GLP8_9GAMM|nr:sulfatase-like hydrolase/transferase [Colwelliaceae bacterium S1-1]